MTVATTAETYDRQTATFLAMVGQNMPEISGDVMRWWIENPHALQNALRTAFCPPEAVAAPREFKTWKTVRIGTQKSVENLSKALAKNGFRINDWAADILKRTPLAEAETELSLVLVSGADLGFTKAVNRDAICGRAKELGLGLVPAEVGPQLRLAYPDQPLDECVLMAMESIAASDGTLRIFRVAHYEDGRWLYAGYGFPGSEWNPDRLWVFVQRKQN